MKTKTFFFKMIPASVCFLAYFILSSSVFTPCYAQVAINQSATNANASAILDLQSGNASVYKGFLPNAMALTATNSASPVIIPATGLIVYNTATAGTSPYNVVPGYYYWTGTMWAGLGGSSVADTSSVAGTGINDYVARWTPNGTTLGTGLIQDNDTGVGINIAPVANTVLTVVGGPDYAINGFSGSGTGIWGRSDAAHGYGVLATHGTDPTGVGLFADGDTAGIFMGSKEGIYANAVDPFGNYAGVKGNDNTGVGIYGSTDSGYGVYGAAFSLNSGIGAGGFSTRSFGMYGYSDYSAGVLGGSGNNIGVYGTSDTSFGVSGYTFDPQGQFAGVIGQDNNGTGVFGYSSSTSSDNAGVLGVDDPAGGFGVMAKSYYGIALGAYSTSGWGIVGSSDSTEAIYGTSIKGYGVNGTSDYSYGVFGYTHDATGTMAGVYGEDDNGYGVEGESSAGIAGVLGTSFSGYGVLGSSADNFGVYGSSIDPSMAGVFGMDTSGYGVWGKATTGFGVRGDASSAGGYGVFGESDATTGVGVYGRSDEGTAIIGYAQLGTGILGQSTHSYPLYGDCEATSGSGEAIHGFNHITGTSAHIDYYNGTTQYKILGSGTVSTIVKDTKGDNVILHAPETPEIYFEDYGEGQLVNGKTHISLDPTIAQNVTISEKHPLRVFIQLRGDCKGTYVCNESTTGFDVEELGGGTSNAAFNWHIVCNRADEVMPTGKISQNADVRLEKAPEEKDMANITVPAKHTHPSLKMSPNKRLVKTPDIEALNKAKEEKEMKDADIRKKMNQVKTPAHPKIPNMPKRPAQVTGSVKPMAPAQPNATGKN